MHKILEALWPKDREEKLSCHAPGASLLKENGEHTNMKATQGEHVPEPENIKLAISSLSHPTCRARSLLDNHCDIQGPLAQGKGKKRKVP